MNKRQPTSVEIDEYIAAFSPEVRLILSKIRLIVGEVAPEAVEKISYRMPAFFLGGVLIYFAAFKKHIGIYPPVRGDDELLEKLGPYRGEKGNLKFPLDQPIPYPLIKRVVRCRLEENRTKIANKRK